MFTRYVLKQWFSNLFSNYELLNAWQFCRGRGVNYDVWNFDQLKWSCQFEPPDKATAVTSTDVNRPHFEARTRPKPKLGPSPHLFLESDLGLKAKFTELFNIFANVECRWCSKV